LKGLNSLHAEPQFPAEVEASSQLVSSAPCSCVLAFHLRLQNKRPLSVH